MRPSVDLSQPCMSQAVHSFGCHVSSISVSPAGDAAYALSHVFGNEWSGQITITRASGDVLTLQQQHGVTSAAWLGGGEAAVFGNEEGDLVCVRPTERAGLHALEEAASAADFDAPVAGACACCDCLWLGGAGWGLSCCAQFVT
jgi:hypothetical protein